MSERKKWGRDNGRERKGDKVRETRILTFSNFVACFILFLLEINEMLFIWLSVANKTTNISLLKFKPIISIYFEGSTHLFLI